MSLVRNISNVLRISSTYKSTVPWARVMSSTPVPTKPEESKPKPVIANPTTGSSHKPDNLEKKFLVWTGKYKSVDDVPEYINQVTMDRSRNKIRIRGANIMILLTLVGCIWSVYSGKKAAKSGESVEKYNLDWHKKYNEANTKSG